MPPFVRRPDGCRRECAVSPLSIIVETLRVTLKPLSRIAIVMAVIMLLPDSGSAAATSPPPGEIVRPAAAAHAIAQGSPTRRKDTTRLPVSTVTLEVDLGGLPASAFGDHDDTGR